MIYVKIEKGNNSDEQLEKALKLFKQKIKNLKWMEVIEQHHYYTKKSAIRRDKKNKGKLRQRARDYENK